MSHNAEEKATIHDFVQKNRKKDKKAKSKNLVPKNIK